MEMFFFFFFFNPNLQRKPSLNDERNKAAKEPFHTWSIITDLTGSIQVSVKCDVCAYIVNKSIKLNTERNANLAASKEAAADTARPSFVLDTDQECKHKFMVNPQPSLAGPEGSTCHMQAFHTVCWTEQSGTRHICLVTLSCHEVFLMGQQHLSKCILRENSAT